MDSPRTSPGDGHDFIIEAAPGERVSFATGLVERNDCFIASPDTGLERFDAANDVIVSIAVG